jgi:hypothetical protein
MSETTRLNTTVIATSTRTRFAGPFLYANNLHKEKCHARIHIGTVAHRLCTISQPRNEATSCRTKLPV